jgi:hypothetical protein
VRAEQRFSVTKRRFLNTKDTEDPAPAATGSADRAAEAPKPVEPLVVINPYVPQRGPIAVNAQ